VKAKYLQITTFFITAAGLVFVAFLYSTEPRSLSEVSSKGQVILGTYEIDRTQFEQGLASFKRDEFIAARAAFDRADPQKRDPITQFYTAYSFYRQGWGRLSNDDALFGEGIAAADRVIAIDPSFRIADESLVMKTAHELKAEMEEGLKITLSDFNPMRLTMERK
jgi:glutamine cyclotransferase